MLSMSHILLVLLIILIVFGAGKLPQVMGDFAKGIKNFRDNLKEEDKKIDHKDQDKDK